MLKRSAITILVILFVALVGTSVQAYEIGDVNLEGETITFVSWGDPLGLEGDLEMQELVKQAEEKFNCKIEVKSLGWGNYVEGLTTRLMSGDSRNDVWEMISIWFWPMVGKGALYPADNAVSADYYEDFNAEYQVFDFEGSRYDLQDPHPGTSLEVLWWNKDMFEEIGLPNLYDLYEQGPAVWNWDKFEEIARKATKDTDGDGSIDRYGLSNLMNSWASWAFANGATPFTTNENGRVIYNFNTPAAKETIRQIYDWCRVDNIVHPWKPNFFKNEKSAMQVKQLWYGNDIKDFDAGFEAGMVPLPVGPNYDGEDFVMSAKQFRTKSLPANSKNPEKLADLVYFLYEGRYAEEEEEAAFEEDVMGFASDQESFKIAMKERWTGEGIKYFHFIRRSNPALRSLISEVINGEQGIAYLDEIEPQIQSVLDEVLQQD